MSYNPYLYNNIRGNYTFQRFAPPFVPPPPPPPAYFIPPMVLHPENSDADFIKSIENQIPAIKPKTLVTKVSISQVRTQLRDTVLLLNDLKNKETILKDQLTTLSDEEWNKHLNEIEENKNLIDKTLSHINGSYLDVLRKLLAKRSAKRLRLKRLRVESKKETDERIKESKERSRKIDENLQKIQDGINRAKQEEEAKIQADIVLKEVMRKKQDAKKCIVKLDALVKLRRARQNTARGRGDNVSETDTLAFNSNIDKLKSLWTHKLSVYKTEEVELRAKLNQDSEANQSVNETEKEVRTNLGGWRQYLFGGNLPQVDFGGDIGRFVTVRSQWDNFVSDEGSPLPIGWVIA